MSTRNMKFLVSLVMIALSLSVVSAQSDTVYFELTPGNKIWIEGTSNLHNWTVVSSEPNGEFKALIPPEKSRSRRSIDIADIGENFPGGTILLPVTSIKSGNLIMDRIMHKSLSARKHPLIKFEFHGTKDVMISEGPDAWQLIAFGTMEIGGVRREIDFQLSVNLTESRQLSINGSRTILMTDYQIDPPTALGGLLKTGNEIRLHLELHASPKLSQIALSQRMTDVISTQ